MQKTLKTIQTLSKIGKVLSNIVFVIMLVGIALCIVGMAGLLNFGTIKIMDGVTIWGLIENEAGLSAAAVNSAMAGAIIMLIGEAVVAKLAARYFKHELAAGTPFTLKGAKELKWLGILTIVIPLAAGLIAAIVQSIIGFALGGANDTDTQFTVDLSIGIAFLIFSVICKYGAEREAELTAPAPEPLPEFPEQPE